jgi:hypothetical protein
MNYSSHERVLAALQHKEHDQVPFDMGSMARYSGLARLFSCYNI